MVQKDVVTLQLNSLEDLEIKSELRMVREQLEFIKIIEWTKAQSLHLGIDRFTDGVFGRHQLLPGANQVQGDMLARETGREIVDYDLWIDHVQVSLDFNDVISEVKGDEEAQAGLLDVWRVLTVSVILI